MTNNKDYFTVKEFADLTDVSRVTVFKKIKSGQIKAEKIGRNYIIYKKDLSGMFDNTLTEENKDDIKSGVQKVLKDYGETIKMLGRE
ncbi:MAG: helix-turn-helix domain-containing protein [Patescibacteria group bacterium]|nr:helix-turn-helix domain-containing protein [Patescibacteria group bacterium]